MLIRAGFVSLGEWSGQATDYFWEIFKEKLSYLPRNRKLIGRRMSTTPSRHTETFAERAPLDDAPAVTDLLG